jgi:phosphopantothenoylcysteine decarboxylase / phosphopantothenate---cysteine ligase
MGLALAEEARRRGAEVTVVAANVSLARGPGISFVNVETAAELRAATIERFDACDILIMAAAVADYRPARAIEGKIAKEEAAILDVELERTADVLTELSERRREGQALIGFAAEHGAGGLERARRKLAGKGLDMVVLNDVAVEGIGFDADDNEVVIVTPGGEQTVSRRGKEAVAAAILDGVQQLLPAQRSSGRGAERVAGDGP